MDENPDKVVIEIDLASLWVGGEEGSTFAELVAAMAAQRLLKDATAARADLLGRTLAIRDDLIVEALRPLIAEALERIFQPTDAFGTAKGAPTTLHEMIVALARKELTEKRGDGFRSGKTTIVEDFIRKEVHDALGKELQGVVREAKEKVLAAVRDRAGEVISETIERVAAGRGL